MRQVCYSVAISLDGFIAGPRGEYDWIVTDPDFDFRVLSARFDTILMGRKTYELWRRHGGGIPGTEAYVFSCTLAQQDCPGVIVSDTPEETVAALKVKPGKDLWLFGGGELFRSLLELNLVDRIEVAIVPVVLGRGLPFLPETDTRHRLKLMGHRVYEKTGTVMLDYALAG